ncbi:bifunctional UDP-N-acetylglucosamine diphosphorylase/glucosamine-1-phosphate N-acetyltransferase GlmU [Salipiger sp. IMCC34102]|uniref:bifunctional UDP-N-acetylglucosamine diphosphorylase/glucosamine-1-phosphate N-acetyltransferase GlmU n=1 Tax=Salipiger sp. IMCC34102 TaxID=2510647 RepID=UPI00101D7648|nr:bifunctional UDP-N-acetylglucosamine diphosphorylase/glucosamine-1-phosphate N-acetyltransferase GlmU [Salipiger sp. IMCC34102]RYH03090.1 bifunctional UDP-N-acetylglucosamine diphosphorylase/glucosamine-1-phosphate N-acetyltransferase GlmU [Salipiger sp. IMCC34102]
MATALIVLAAGKGSRMNSDLPKVLHPIGAAPLLVHALDAGGTLDPDRTVVVTGHGAEAVERTAARFDDRIVTVRQDAQLGTAHAVAQARPALDGFDGDAVVLYGDTPFIEPATLEAMKAARADHDIVVLGFEAADPGRYGRLVMEGDSLQAIVEYKDADAATRALTLCNSGVICADAKTLFSLIEAVGNDNASGEYYLTDIVGLARARGLSAGVVTCAEAETLGINTRAELAAAEAAFQARKRARAIEDGVILPAPETVIFAQDTHVGADTLVEPYVVFAPGVTVESGATIRAFSHLEGCHVSRDAVVGPYARLRPGATLSEGAKVGNFVEVKNATLGAGAKVNHLSYVGDAEVGAAANLGAGTVTCNYDGYFKHKTTIGAGAFIGSSTMLVAPVSVGDGAVTASGSVVTMDVPPGDLAMGRARQTNKTGLGARLMGRLKALKSKGIN